MLVCKQNLKRWKEMDSAALPLCCLCSASNAMLVCKQNLKRWKEMDSAALPLCCLCSASNAMLVCKQNLKRWKEMDSVALPLCCLCSASNAMLVCYKIWKDEETESRALHWFWTSYPHWPPFWYCCPNISTGYRLIAAFITLWWTSELWWTAHPCHDYQQVARLSNTLLFWCRWYLEHV